MKFSTHVVLIAFSTAALAAAPAQAYTYKKIYDFCSKRACIDGVVPQAGLTVDAHDNLYGTASNGAGLPQGGLVFELRYQPLKKTWKYHRLHQFCSLPNCADGSNPIAPPIVDVNGNLYGVATGGAPGCGTVYELQPVAKSKKPKFSLLYTFPFASGCGNGGLSQAALSYAGKASGLAYDGTSPLYGVSPRGGAGGFVFSITPTGTSWIFTDLYDFCQKADCADGASPFTEVTVDGNGNLFGVAGGGKKNGGVAYELSPGSGTWSETVLYAYCVPSHCHDGASPSSALLADAAGDFFGATLLGGSRHDGCCGVLYKLTPSGTDWTQSIAYDFCSLRDCDDGANPTGSLVMDASGALIGSTRTGGGHNSFDQGSGGGTVFRQSGSALETLYAFCATGSTCEDGENPLGIAIDASGNLFGMTRLGGETDDGVVFELSP